MTNRNIKFNPISRILILILYPIIIISFLTVLYVSFSYPQNNLFPTRTAVISLSLLIITGILMLIWNRYFPRLSKAGLCYYICLIAFGIALFAFEYSLGDRWSTSLEDYIVMYQAALEHASGLQLSYPQYFLTYGNNVAPMLLLSMLMRLGSYPLLLLISVLQTVVVAWASGVIAGPKLRLPVLMGFILFLPIWGMAAFFYTDTMSFGSAIIALALLILSCKNGRKSKKIILLILSCMIMALGMLWKITSFIPVIALAIIGLLSIKSDRKGLITRIFTFVIITLLSYSFFCALLSVNEVYSTSRTTTDPAISWVAFSIEGDGSWNSGYDFIQQLHTLPDTESKKEFSVEYLKSNYGKAFEIEHLRSKLTRNFASGNMGVRDFLASEDDGSIIWDLFAPYGAYYWYSSQYCMCFIIAIYLCLTIGAMINYVKLLKGNTISLVSLVSHLSFLGLIIFLMLWESNNRQLYNQIPILLIGAFSLFDQGRASFSSAKTLQS